MRRRRARRYLPTNGNAAEAHLPSAEVSTMMPTLSRESGEAAPEVVRNDPRDLAAAITRDWRPYRWRAYVVGTLVGLIAGGICAPIATTTLELVLSLGGITIDPHLPWAEVIWSTTFVVTFAAGGAWGASRWLPTDFRAAVESYAWLSVRADERWRTVFGDRPVPRSVRAMRDFVTETPEAPESAGERFAAWLVLGDIAAARRVIGQMPGDTPLERETRVAATWMADFAGGTVGDLAPLLASASAIEDPADRLEAYLDIAANRARIEVAAGRDWKPPLAAVRERLGPEPVPTAWRQAWTSTFRGMLAAGAIGVGAYWAFTLLR
jgi:hypothetical protein